MIIEMANEEYTVEFLDDAKIITDILKKDNPAYITFDTETDGLHIKKARPFLAAVAWDGKVFVFEATRNNLYHLSNWSKSVRRVFAHNAN